MNAVIFATRTPTAADHMARVAAAARVKAERETAERKAAAERDRKYRFADMVLDHLRAEGAVRVGMKVYLPDAKYRTVNDINDPGLRISIASTADTETEVWGLDADGEHTGSTF